MLKNINYNESKNKIIINNLEIINNKISNIEEIKFDFLSENNFMNQINLVRKKDNFNLIGKSFDSMQLIENISNSVNSKNFFDIFDNLNSKIKIDISEVKLDDISTVNDLKGNLEIRNSKIFDLDLNSNFIESEKLFVSIKTQNDNSTVTTFYSDRAKPFVKKYKL